MRWKDMCVSVHKIKCHFAGWCFRVLICWDFAPWKMKVPTDVIWFTIKCSCGHQKCAHTHLTTHSHTHTHTHTSPHVHTHAHFLMLVILFCSWIWECMAFSSLFFSFCSFLMVFYYIAVSVHDIIYTLNKSYSNSILSFRHFPQCCL